jgi:hypothetical protein
MAPVSWSFSTPSCPCSIWDGSTTPAVAATSETQAVELGVKFRSDIDGYITGIRFYKGAGNTGTHVGSLWGASGTLLGSATFTGETATGWQQVLFGSPIAINANTTYVASYHAPNGHFAVDTGYFDHGPVGGLVRALADGAQGGNGLYRFGASGFPTGSYQASNYWVDVVFDTSGGSGGGAAARVAAPAPDAPAERGGSLGLNGSSGYATVPHHAELNVTGDWTVEAWFKDESPGGFNHPETYLLTKGDTAADDEVPYFLAIERGDLVVGERTDGTDQVARYDLAAGGVRARTWHHVAATMQASSRTLTIYLDGKRVHQVRLDAHSATGNTRPLTIGRNGSRGRWRGNLDDVRIWNVVRSEAQIRSAYEEELDDAPAGLVGNWKFNERRGASSADDGGTAQDATLRGGAKRANDVHP